MRTLSKSLSAAALLFFSACSDDATTGGAGGAGAAAGAPSQGGSSAGGSSAGGTANAGGAGASSVGGDAQGGALQGGASSGGAAPMGGSGGGGPTVEDPGLMTSDARIYTTDGTEYVIDEVGDAFSHAAATASDNLVFYVHGRGCGGNGEPDKSLGDSMPAMEADYSARVIMFNWQGSDVGCPLGFPEDEARAAGPAFAHTLEKLAYYRVTHPGALTGLKVTLITHSMGSLVLESATGSGPLPTGLFDTVVLNAAASARAGHAAWVALVPLSAALYVTENDDDNILTAASVLGGVRLGKNVDGEPLASNAAYVDFTASSVNHAYYVHGGQDGAHMTAFYDAVMNGLPFDFAQAAGIASVESRDGTAIYSFDGN
ncbi:MAG: hypothetical protein U0271_10300 [Polyangiaceae bacterium]